MNDEANNYTANNDTVGNEVVDDSKLVSARVMHERSTAIRRFAGLIKIVMVDVNKYAKMGRFDTYFRYNSRGAMSDYWPEVCGILVAQGYTVSGPLHIGDRFKEVTISWGDESESLFSWAQA